MKGGEGGVKHHQMREEYKTMEGESEAKKKQ